MKNVVLNHQIWTSERLREIFGFQFRPFVTGTFSRVRLFIFQIKIVWSKVNSQISMFERWCTELFGSLSDVANFPHWRCVIVASGLSLTWKFIPARRAIHFSSHFLKNFRIFQNGISVETQSFFSRLSQNGVCICTWRTNSTNTIEFYKVYYRNLIVNPLGQNGT